jgi:hypothetical protein
VQDECFGGTEVDVKACVQDDSHEEETSETGRRKLCYTCCEQLLCSFENWPVSGELFVPSYIVFTLFPCVTLESVSCRTDLPLTDSYVYERSLTL